MNEAAKKKFQAIRERYTLLRDRHPDDIEKNTFRHVPFGTWMRDIMWLIEATEKLDSGDEVVVAEQADAVQ